MNRQTALSALLTTVFTYINALTFVIISAVVGMHYNAPELIMPAVATLLFAWVATYTASGETYLSNREVFVIRLFALATIVTGAITAGTLAYVLTGL